MSAEWARSADLMNVFGLDADAVFDRALRGRRGLGDFIVLRHSLFERFDAFGDIAHDVGNLALAAEQQQRDRAEQHPMPNTEATHGRLPDPRRRPVEPAAHPRSRKPKREMPQKQACLRKSADQRAGWAFVFEGAQVGRGSARTLASTPRERRNALVKQAARYNEVQ